MTRRLALKLIGWYRSARFFFPASCRYTPSCSEYAQQAFERYAFLRALGLTTKRLCRCRPFGPSGWDPVP